jgi:hypothetical protein
MHNQQKFGERIIGSASAYVQLCLFGRAFRRDEVSWEDVKSRFDSCNKVDKLFLVDRLLSSLGVPKALQLGAGIYVPLQGEVIKVPPLEFSVRFKIQNGKAGSEKFMDLITYLVNNLPERSAYQKSWQPTCDKVNDRLFSTLFTAAMERIESGHELDPAAIETLGSMQVGSQTAERFARKLNKVDDLRAFPQMLDLGEIVRRKINAIDL